jgi:SRSO17 transposase
MTEQELKGLAPALGDFLGSFSDCFASERTSGHFGVYIRGLLSDLPRKTCEPIALQAGTPVRTLQEFLKDHVWDFQDLRRRLQSHVALSSLAQAPADDLGTVGIADETSVAKKGDKTPGVQRQYLGCKGKIDNGIVTVHLGVSKGRYKTLVDADLFLPKAWSKDRKRCRQAGIPDDLVHRPKWRIVLEQIDRVKEQGVTLDWMTFDEGYGSCPAFLYGLDSRKQSFVGEVPRTFSCLAATKNGKRPSEEVKARQAREVVRCSSAFRSQQWQAVRLSRETMQDQAWRVKAALVWLHGKEGWSSRAYWLIWACNEETGEEKFFLSNAPVDASVLLLVRVAFRRWNVEHSFRVCKSELGFGHFEGRNYMALMRQLTLCLTAMTFAADHTERLREKKSGRDSGAGVPSLEPAQQAMAGAAAPEQRGSLRPEHHQPPSAPQPRRLRLQEEEARRRPLPQEAPTQEGQAPARADRCFHVAL